MCLNIDPFSETLIENYISSLYILKLIRNTLTSALLERIANVFSKYIYSIIRKVAALRNRKLALRAIVTMQFPSFALYNCVIILEICKGEVEHFIKDLFEIDISFLGPLSGGPAYGRASA